MSFAVVGYRNWAMEIANHLLSNEVTYFTSLPSKLEIESFDLIFFVGWSEIIPIDIINTQNCICIHPSMLPQFRGGSPIQNQILTGIKESGLSFFIMDEGVDTGPIVLQLPLSLDGKIEDIFQRMTIISSVGISLLINQFENEGMLSCVKQDESKASFYKRRKPEESEILPSDFLEFTADQLRDKVLCLRDPYPNAFVTCSDGRKLIIKDVSIE